jgi:hypothetical protein
MAPRAVPVSAPRPGEVCRALLAALEASEGRRRRRKRDTTADAIGLGLKRTLLRAVAEADPAPEAFEGWLLARCLTPGAGESVGSLRATAVQILDEWRLAQAVGDFAGWLAHGAPSDDRLAEDERAR